MRDPKEIQRAHDLLSSMVSENIPSLDRDSQIAIHAAADVLCWVLEHTHNPAFAANLLIMEKYVKDCGFDVAEAAKPN